MKKGNFFWICYSDLMTSLFFIMLVLFVVTTGFLEIEKSDAEAARNEAEAARKATEEQLEKVEELQTAVKQLPEEYFSYQPQYKRFKLKKQIQFQRGDADINPIYSPYLIDVGRSINGLIDSLNSNEEYKKFDIKYLIVIEGMASKDNFIGNFELSYERALSLYKFWERKGIVFKPEICEVQIAGSGTDGVREFSGKEEYKNQQFLIHIVPKMGKVKDKALL